MTPRDWKLVRESETAYYARLDEYRSEAQTLRVYEELWLQAVETGALAAAYQRDDLTAKIQMAQTLNSRI